MKIIRAEVWRESLNLTEPYTIAYETYTRAEIVFMRLETNTGITAFGAATPDVHVTGETAEDTAAAASELLIPILLGSDPLRYGRTTESIRKALPGHPSTKALADIALHDLIGKIAGLPLWQLLGGYRSRIKTCVTVGILDAEATCTSIAGLTEQGINIIKLKGGIDLERDLATLEKIGEVFGRSITLRYDANQGYTEEQALTFVSRIPRTIRMEILEQPVGHDQHAQLGSVTRSSVIPIMADESAAGLFDAYHLVRHDLIDMINIKLMKSGGIAAGLHINSVARAAGVEVMVGCMDECQLGIAAGLHFALSRPNIRFADLDGFLDLENDPTAGCITMHKGYLYPSAKPGLGLSRIAD